LTIHARSGAIFHGTGWLAGPQLLLTCGHCVHHSQMGGWAARIEVIAGLSGTREPFGRSESSSFGAHPAWLASADRAFDIGYIALPEALGQRLGHFAIGKAPPIAVAGAVLRCAGYPDFDGSHSRQLSGVGNTRAVAGSRLFHDIDTDNGTSGGPVWLAGDRAMPPIAIAVHNYEEQPIPEVPGQSANSATLITPDIFAVIRGWLDRSS
jgi:V8-like Glu-specific endopeptidase